MRQDLLKQRNRRKETKNTNDETTIISKLIKIKFKKRNILNLFELILTF